MSVQDIELRYVERTVVRKPAPDCVGVPSVTLHVLQWRKLVRSESEVSRDRVGVVAINFHDRWDPWQDVPMGKEDAS